MFALSLVMKVPGIPLETPAVGDGPGAGSAPLLLTGSLTLFAANGLAIGFLGFVILKAMKGK